MKILFVARELAEYGGAEQQLLVLARGLVQRGHVVSVAVLYRGGLLEERFSRAGIEVIDLAKAGRFAFFGSVRALHRLVRRVRPDIVHGYLGLPNLLVLIARAALPQAAAVAGLRASDMDLRNYDWLHRMLLQVERRAIRFHDLCIVNSRNGAEHFRQCSPGARLLHIANGIDTERFRPHPELRSRARASWKVGEETRVIGCVARLDPMKDHDTLLRALAMTRHLVPDIRLVCYGAGGDARLARLQALAEELEIAAFVSWYPSAPDLENWYPGFDVHCMSSAFGEGFSNAIGEAMACGVPCVATDVGDATEIVGRTGWVVAPRSPDALSLALVRALSRVGREHDAACRARIQGLYSIQNLVASTEAALLSALERRRVRADARAGSPQ